MTMGWKPRKPKTIQSIQDVASKPGSADAWKNLLINGGADVLTGGLASGLDVTGVDLGKMDPRTAVSKGIEGISGKGLIDGLTGESARKPFDDKATSSLDELSKAYDNLTVPELSNLNLQGHTWRSDLTPEQVSKLSDVKYNDATSQRALAQMLGPSAMGDIGTDPTLRAQQSASLGALKDIANNGGMNLTDQANLARIQGDVGAADRGRRDAILQNMHARGMGGSGQELMAQLAGNQAATDRQAQQGLDVAGQAQARALQAMMSSNQVAGDIRNQDFSEQARIAAAKDAAAQFNAQQATGMSQYNAGAANSMAQFNAGNQLRNDTTNRDAEAQRLTTNAGLRTQANVFNNEGRQGIANGNVDTANQNAYYNTVTKPQATFGMQNTKIGGKANAVGQGLNYWQHRGDQAQQGVQNLVAGGAQMGAAALPKLLAAAHGGLVPGIAAVSGDSSDNDVVPTMLSPGEAIIPRSVMAHPGKIADFLRGLQPATAVHAAPTTASELAAKLEALKSIAKRGKK